MSSVLITGANGFIGSHLCDLFLARGYEVFALVRRTSDLRFLRGADVRLLRGDLTREEDIAFPERADVIVHAAALVSDNATEEQCRRNIYDVTVALVNQIRRRYPDLQRLIYISSALVLGYCRDGISESRPGKPAAYIPYNRMKRKTEEYLLGMRREAGLPLVILRPGDVYGPRDRTSCELMLKAARKGTPLIVGSGRKRFGFCSPANLCRAVIAAVSNPAAVGRAYTVVNAVAPTWREFFGVLQAGVGKPQRLYVPVSLAFAVALFLEALKRIVPGFRPPLNYYRIRRITSQTTYDVSRTLKELGYESDEDYPEQFRAIVEWYRKETGMDEPGGEEDP